MLCAEVITNDSANNVTDNIYEKIGTNLHHIPSHPIGIIKEAIYGYFDRNYPDTFTKFDDLHPVVTATAVRCLMTVVVSIHLLVDSEYCAIVEFR